MKHHFSIKQFALSAVLILLGYGCTDQASDNNIETRELINHVRQDREFKNIQDAQIERIKNINSEKFDFSSVNRQMIEREIGNCKSEKELIQLYEKAGMKNANEYVKSISKQINALSEMARKYPQLGKLNQIERSKVFNNMFAISDSVVKAQIAAKLNNNHKMYIP